MATSSFASPVISEATPERFFGHDTKVVLFFQILFLTTDNFFSRFFGVVVKWGHIVTSLFTSGYGHAKSF